MPKYAILLYGHAGESDGPPNAEQRTSHDDHAEELEDKGDMLAAFAFASPKSARSIRASGVSNGPFISSGEAVLGAYVIEASDLEAALETARRNPIIEQGGGVEVRPVEGFMIRTNSV
ncbi:MAG: YciI family protein [Actinomycetota bacterium]